MFMFSITKPKKKLKSLLIVACVALLLGVGVPAAYNCLRDVDAMASWAEIFHDDEVLYVTDTLERGDMNTAEIEVESMTGDPIKVNAEDEQPAGEQSAGDVQSEKSDESAEGAAGAAAEEQAPQAEHDDNGSEEAEAEPAEKSFIQKVLAVIFGVDDEVIYYKK